ncbi:TPA: crossover junction endodeoxyribonuclease RuvC [bacterium]|nr:crossover junction endodeoxyribonuclease RuvC [bacterium]
MLLGVDPGLVVTGYGLINLADGRCSLIEAGVIRVKREEDLPMRLKGIYDRLQEILEIHPVDFLIIEDLYSKYTSPKTAILMGHARGVICLAAANWGVPVIGYTATQVKSAITGVGRASKFQIQRMIQKLLDLSSLPEPSDVADALALTIAHAHTIEKKVH